MVCGMAVNSNPEFILSDFVDLVGIDALSDQESLGAFVNLRWTNCTTKM